MIETINTYADNLLYDGEEKNNYENIIVLSEDEKYSIRITEYNYINELVKRINEEQFQDIIKNIPNAKPSKFFPNNYSGSGGLPLKFQLNEKGFLFIISYGEFQPSRFKLYLEGIWKTIPHSI